MRMMFLCVTCAGQQQFLLEARQNRRIAGKIGANNLERDHALEFQVARFVDRAHAAHAEQLDNIIFRCQQYTGLPELTVG